MTPSLKYLINKNERTKKGWAKRLIIKKRKYSPDLEYLLAKCKGNNESS